MSTSPVHVTLATLPPDIIRNIFKCQGIFYAKLSLISQQWNTLSHEHLQYLKLRNINRLCWAGVSPGYNSQKSILSIRISSERCNYFGLDFMVNSTMPQDDNLVEVTEQVDDRILKNIDLLFIVKKSLFIELFELNFTYYPRREQLQEIGHALNGVFVEELRISDLTHLNFEYMESILELISSNCLIKRLVLSPHNKSHFVGLAKTATWDFNDFYTKAATFVSSVQIGIIENIRWNVESTKAEWEQLKRDYEDLLEVNCRLEINDLKDQLFAPTKIDVRILITPRVSIPAPSLNDLLNEID